MSFVVGCQCGKRFKVADEQRGKKAMCPGCGATLRLEPEAAAPPPPPPPPADEGDPFAGFDLEAAAAMERAAVVDDNQDAACHPAFTTALARRPSRQRAEAEGLPLLRVADLGVRPAVRELQRVVSPRDGGGGRTVRRRRSASAAASGDADLSVVEWLLCIFCAPSSVASPGIIYLRSRAGRRRQDDRDRDRRLAVFSPAFAIAYFMTPQQ